MTPYAFIFERRENGSFYILHSFLLSSFSYLIFHYRENLFKLFKILIMSLEIELLFEIR